MLISPQPTFAHARHGLYLVAKPSQMTPRATSNAFFRIAAAGAALILILVVG